MSTMRTEDQGPRGEIGCENTHNKTHNTKKIHQDNTIWTPLGLHCDYYVVWKAVARHSSTDVCQKDSIKHTPWKLENEFATFFTSTLLCSI